MNNSSEKVPGKYDNLEERARALAEQEPEIKIAPTPLDAGVGEEFHLSSTETHSEPAPSAPEQKETSKESAVAHAEEWYRGLEPITQMEVFKSLTQINDNQVIETAPVEEAENKKTEIAEQARKIESGSAALEDLNKLNENRLEPRGGFEPTAVIPEERKDDPGLIIEAHAGETAEELIMKVAVQYPEFNLLEEAGKIYVVNKIIEHMHDHMQEYGIAEGGIVMAETKINFNPIFNDKSNLN